MTKMPKPKILVGLILAVLSAVVVVLAGPTESFEPLIPIPEGLPEFLVYAGFAQAPQLMGLNMALKFDPGWKLLKYVKLIDERTMKERLWMQPTSMIVRTGAVIRADREVTNIYTKALRYSQAIADVSQRIVNRAVLMKESNDRVKLNTLRYYLQEDGAIAEAISALAYWNKLVELLFGDFQAWTHSMWTRLNAQDLVVDNLEILKKMITDTALPQITAYKVARMNLNQSARGSEALKNQERQKLSKFLDCPYFIVERSKIIETWEANTKKHMADFADNQALRKARADVRNLEKRYNKMRKITDRQMLEIKLFVLKRREQQAETAKRQALAQANEEQQTLDNGDGQFRLVRPKKKKESLREVMTRKGRSWRNALKRKPKKPKLAPIETLRDLLLSKTPAPTAMEHMKAFRTMYNYDLEKHIKFLAEQGQCLQPVGIFRFLDVPFYEVSWRDEPDDKK